MNRLFVANKPTGVSSNYFLKGIKRKYKVKKAGYSGTLDPFANGCLIVAFGQYSKLFRFLQKTPKRYEATLFLGAFSETLDIEKIEKVIEVKPIDKDMVQNTLNSLVGELEYLPPRYSAKKINGKKAYELAREDIEFELKKIKSTIYDIKLISYQHPYIHFNISVSEGSYIRSIGAIIAHRLDTIGVLKTLKRINEGRFFYDNEKSLNPIDFLKTKKNSYLLDKFDILLGRKLKASSFEINKDGEYHLVIDAFLSIVQIKDNKVTYLLNKVALEDLC
jgi:tRNA pseudouridine55 synthase